MAAGRKTGGRTKGTPNKRTIEVRERLVELGCDPIQGMAMIAMNSDNPPELRGRMFAELAQYTAPKRKAVEVPHELERQFVIMVPEPCRTSEEWVAKYAPTVRKPVV
jgi:hypothetical protein